MVDARLMRRQVMSGLFRLRTVFELHGQHAAKHIVAIDEMMLERRSDVQQRDDRTASWPGTRGPRGGTRKRAGSAAMKSGSVNRPNQLTGKLRADDISQPTAA